MKIENLPATRGAHAAPIPQGIRRSLRDPRIREPGVGSGLALDTAQISGVIAMFISGMGTIARMPNGVHDLGTGDLLFSAALFIACFLTSFAIIGAGRASRWVATHDRKVIGSARSRVLDLINDGYGFVSVEAEAHYARTVVCNPDDWTGGRELLMRLDAVAVQHAETNRRIQHDPEKCSVARSIARKACYDMIADFRQEHGDRGVDGEIEDLSRACRAIASERPLDAKTSTYAPTARIARIISTAERMLADHPDLVDAQGARVDDLIRVHVPRLLERHRVAAESASAKDLEAVDAQLDIGVEKIRESVQEAADAIHDEAMQALSTELRFLSLRRGTTPLLTAVS